MTVDEKAFDAAYEAYRDTPGDHPKALREAITAYLSARSAEPVAWRYELASAVKHHSNGSKTGENWKWHLTDFAPNVPDWSIRNLKPLYAHPTPEASDV